MKIAVLTHPPRLNFGGILQAYALQVILERMGHHVQILSNNYIGKHPSWKLPLVYILRLIKRCIGDKKMVIFWEREMKKKQLIISQNTQRFVHNKIHIKNLKNLTELQPNDYDAYIVGSDQIWRAKYIRSLWRTTMPNVFLKFAEGWDVKRIAYAASFGVDNIEEYTEREIEQCRQALQLFDKVTVREKSGVEICKNKLGCNALQVVDPTMLLRKDDYVKLVNEATTIKSDGNLMTYILDPSSAKQEIISSIAKKKDLKPFKSNADPYNEALEIDLRIQPSVEQWIRGFIDSEIIVTDSFHACVFSIIFNKPFIAIGNKTRGLSRFESLLNVFGLRERLIEENQEYDTILNKKINWDDINYILEKERNKGLEIFQSL